LALYFCVSIVALKLKYMHVYMAHSSLLYCYHSCLSLLSTHFLVGSFTFFEENICWL